MNINSIFNYAGCIVGILGILLSLYLFKRGLEIKDPRCYYKTVENIAKLPTENDSKIRVFYEQEEVDRVFTTYVWIWNQGKKPINKLDIPTKTNIKITLCDDKNNPKILDYKIIKTTRGFINFKATLKDDTSLTISFDFLDQGDGVVLEIQHTGSFETALKTEGIILGVPKGIKIIEERIDKTSFYYPIYSIYSHYNLFKMNTRKALRFMVLSWLILILVSTIAGGLSYYFNKNAVNITISSSELRETLFTEFTQLSEENYQKIIEKLTKNSKKIESVMIYFLIVPLFIMGLSIFGMWKMGLSPYPKSLHIERFQE